MRRILNRMDYRLKKIQKGKPLKKTEHTDAVFKNVLAVKVAESGRASQLAQMAN